MANLALGENGIRWPGERIDFEIEQTGKRAEIPYVLASQDHAYTRQAASLRSIDREVCVRMRRA